MAALDARSVLILSAIATGGLVLMWGVFWFAVSRSKESITNVLLNQNFFRVVTIMGIIAATAVLGLAGRLSSIAGTILSGIAGYVLGHVSSRTAGTETKGKKGAPKGVDANS